MGQDEDTLGRRTLKVGDATHDENGMSAGGNSMRNDLPLDGTVVLASLIVQLDARPQSIPEFGGSPVAQCTHLPGARYVNTFADSQVSGDA